MSQAPLDPFTADRLLSGSIDPDQAPPGYEGVASLLGALSVQATEAELAGEKEAIAAMSAALTSGPERSLGSRRSFGVSRSLRLKVVAGALVASLALGTGLAFAGSLPAGFQKVASSVLAKVGINVPGPNSNTGSPNVTSTSVPEAALFGLCTAWQSGQGGVNGKKDRATTFTRLSGAAGAAESVQDFCTGVIAAHNAAHPAKGASGQSNNGTSTADTKSGGHSSTGLGHKP